MMRLQWLHFCWYWVMLFATGIYLLWCWESVDVQQWLVRFMFSLTNIYLCKKNFWDISAVVAELRFRCFCLSNLHFNSCIYDILYSTCYFQLQLVFAFSVVILQGVWICDSICQNGMITFLVLWIWRQRFLFSFSLFSRQCVQKYYSIRNLGNNKDFVLSLARFIKKSISCHAVDLTLETWLGLCSAFCLRPIWGGGGYHSILFSGQLIPCLLCFSPWGPLLCCSRVYCVLWHFWNTIFTIFDISQSFGVFFGNLYPSFVCHRSELARFANTFYYFSGFRSIIKED